MSGISSTESNTSKDRRGALRLVRMPYSLATFTQQVLHRSAVTVKPSDLRPFRDQMMTVFDSRRLHPSHRKIASFAMYPPDR
jgi:hypothetical protein